MKEYLLWGNIQGRVLIRDNYNFSSGVQLIRDVSWANPPHFTGLLGRKLTAYIPLVVWDKTVPSSKNNP